MVAIDNGDPPTYSLPWKEPCVWEEEDSRKAKIQKTEHLRNLNLLLQADNLRGIDPYSCKILLGRPSALAATPFSSSPIRYHCHLQVPLSSSSPLSSTRISLLSPEVPSASSSPVSVSSHEGIRLLSGRFTKLCERLRMVLVATHILVYLFPSALTYLALVESMAPDSWEYAVPERKKKLSERFFTLQQLVSPYGKKYEPVYRSMNQFVLSGLQNGVLFVDGLKIGTTTKSSFAIADKYSEIIDVLENKS
ncbi:uncharacterized protein DS421_19g656220 [Arachis hypogaea]|uniref:Uncharacterized protein n=1 Tax=Arachis hypogaea TaxID=3818 RepID=A0A6B9V8T1_ARAHY|nr:uncharacterized protein DS421_19g656220 [Arachis hypogaea]